MLMMFSQVVTWHFYTRSEEGDKKQKEDTNAVERWKIVRIQRAMFLSFAGLRTCTGQCNALVPCEFIITADDLMGRAS